MTDIKIKRYFTSDLLRQENYTKNKKGYQR